MAGSNVKESIPGWAAVEAVDDDAPSPIPGVDWQTFRNFLTRALNGDETVPSVMLQRVNAALQGGETNLEKRDRRWWQDFFLRESIAQSLRAIDGLIDRYNEMADWHHEQAGKARARMLDAAGKLEEIDGFLGPASDVIDTAGRTGKLDREQTLKLLGARHVPITGNEDDQTLMRMLIAERQKALRERTVWSDEYGSAEADAKRHTDLEEENRRKARELVERRDAIRNGGLDAEEEERRLRDIAEEYEADVRRKAAAIEKERQTDQPATGLTAVSLDAATNSQASQAETQVSDFETLAAGMLKQEFTQAATIPSPPTPERPKPNNPSLSV